MGKYYGSTSTIGVYIFHPTTNILTSKTPKEFKNADIYQKKINIYIHTLANIIKYITQGVWIISL